MRRAIIFCADPLQPRSVDPDYLSEWRAAQAAGFETALIRYEALTHEHDATKAIRQIQEDERVAGIYRGWMVSLDAYSRLYAALDARGVRLINTPDQYHSTHHLPEWIGTLAEHTPATVVISLNRGTQPDIDQIMATLQWFGSRPLILKDYVKSRKHEWAEACFIPSAADRTAVEPVVRNFVERQGDDLVGGLVFREFADLQPVGTHPASRMPLFNEYRIFIRGGFPMIAWPYWGEYGGQEPPGHLFQHEMRRINSPFYTMDVAQRRDGSWIILELGDGQVSGLPEGCDPAQFYTLLAVPPEKRIEPSEG